jgi:hypothetical protein
MASSPATTAHVVTSTETEPAPKPRKERPCDACRKRKSRCVINEDAKICVLCEFHHQECTFLYTPQPRKRKINDVVVEERAARRYGVFATNG